MVTGTGAALVKGSSLMGIYRVLWRSGMGAVAAVGAVFAVLDLPADALLALGICAVVLGASAGAAIRAGTRSVLVSSGALAASAVALLGTFAVAGLLTLLGPAALLQVALLGMLSPTMLGRLGVTAPALAHPGGDREAGAPNPPPDCSTLSDDQLGMCWRSSFVALHHTVLPGERLYLVETRAALLEVFAHRHPQAFTDWLHNTHAASTPPPCFTAAVRDAPTPPKRDPQP